MIEKAKKDLSVYGVSDDDNDVKNVCLYESKTGFLSLTVTRALVAPSCELLSPCFCKLHDPHVIGGLRDNIFSAHCQDNVLKERST